MQNAPIHRTLKMTQTRPSAPIPCRLRVAKTIAATAPIRINQPISRGLQLCPGHSCWVAGLGSRLILTTIVRRMTGLISDRRRREKIDPGATRLCDGSVGAPASLTGANFARYPSTPNRPPGLFAAEVCGAESGVSTFSIALMLKASDTRRR